MLAGNQSNEIGPCTTLQAWTTNNPLQNWMQKDLFLLLLHTKRSYKENHVHYMYMHIIFFLQKIVQRCNNVHVHVVV